MRLHTVISRRIIMDCFALLVMTIIFMSQTFAVMPDERLKDSALEARARTISQELRCLICQNQSIDDSDATIAKDLRLLVRERLTKGESDQQVISYIRDRYGDFVLLKPPFNFTTLMLWLLPFFILFLGLFFIIKRYRENPYKEESDV